MSITPSVGGRLRPSERRLLLGYGPAVVIAAAFLLMTLLVPTVAPEQNVSAAGPGGGAATQGLGATSGLPASGTGSTGNGAASPG
ncbi:MAG: hypothetical protein ACR2NJ_12610, partial [Acidimicrobiales bacterium]